MSIVREIKEEKEEQSSVTLENVHAVREDNVTNWLATKTLNSRLDTDADLVVIIF